MTVVDGVKGNKQGLFSPGGRTLQILSATEEDAGRYTCVAANEAGETLKNYAVKVFGELLHRHAQPATHVRYLWFCMENIWGGITRSTARGHMVQRNTLMCETVRTECRGFPHPGTFLPCDPSSVEWS